MAEELGGLPEVSAIAEMLARLQRHARSGADVPLTLVRDRWQAT